MVGSWESTAARARPPDEVASALGPSDTRSLIEHATGHLAETIATQQLVARRCMPALVAAAQLIAGAFASERKLLLCGNGGSAADCQHVAAEFVSRLRADFERPPLPAVALTTDTSFLTGFANDYGVDGIFARQVQALGQSGDVLVAISTSGRSRNVARAIAAAGAVGVRTVGLFGEGGALEGDVDMAITVPSRDTQVIQECMLSMEHILCELVEEALFGPACRGVAEMAT